MTIAIPTYNRAATFLPRALSAACGQTYRNLDILVSDNASADDTAALVGTFADSRIRYHRQDTNIGGTRNLQFCIERSKGDYTVLLMDDDSIDSDFVATCIDAAREQPDAGIVRTGSRVIDADGTTRYMAPNLCAGLDFTRFVLAWTEGKTAQFLCSKMFRTAPLQAIGMNSKHNLWDDVMAELKIACRHGRIDIPEIKATFCWHGEEHSAAVEMREWCEESKELIDLVCRLAPADETLLRSRLNPYIAALNYRTAARLRKWWPARVAAYVEVYRTFGVPPKGDLWRALVRETPGYKALRGMARALYSAGRS